MEEENEEHDQDLGQENDEKEHPEILPPINPPNGDGYRDEDVKEAGPVSAKMVISCIKAEDIAQMFNTMFQKEMEVYKREAQSTIELNRELNGKIFELEEKNEVLRQNGIAINELFIVSQSENKERLEEMEKNNAEIRLENAELKESNKYLLMEIKTVKENNLVLSKERETDRKRIIDLENKVNELKNEVEQKETEGIAIIQKNNNALVKIVQQLLKEVRLLYSSLQSVMTETEAKLSKYSDGLKKIFEEKRNLLNDSDARVKLIEESLKSLT